MVKSPSSGPAPQYIRPHRWWPTHVVTIRRKKTLNGYLGILVDGHQADYLEFLFTGGSGDLDFVAHFAVKQGLADRRSGGDEAVLGVGFLGTHQLVFDFDVFLGIEHGQTGAVAGAVLGDVGQVEHAQIAQALFQLADAGVYKSLALFGVFIFGVFGKIAVGASDGNLFGKIDVQLMRELIDFFQQFLFNFGERIDHGVIGQLVVHPLNKPRSPKVPDPACNDYRWGGIAATRGDTPRGGKLRRATNGP